MTPRVDCVAYFSSAHEAIDEEPQTEMSHLDRDSTASHLQHTATHCNTLKIAIDEEPQP